MEGESSVPEKTQCMRLLPTMSVGQWRERVSSVRCAPLRLVLPLKNRRKGVTRETVRILLESKAKDYTPGQ